MIYYRLIYIGENTIMQLVKDLTINNIFFWIGLSWLVLIGLSWIVCWLEDTFYFKGKGLNKSIHIRKRS